MNGGDGVGGGGGGGSTFQHSSAADVVAAAAIARKRFVLRTASSESDGGLGAEWRFSPPPPPEDEDWEGGEYEYGRGPGSDRKSNPAHAQKLYNVSHSTSSSSSVASRVFWSLSLSSYKFTNSSIPRPYACAPACLPVCLPACLPACNPQPSTLGTPFQDYSKKLKWQEDERERRVHDFTPMRAAKRTYRSERRYAASSTTDGK